jgi:hypothetical protein
MYVIGSTAALNTHESLLREAQALAPLILREHSDQFPQGTDQRKVVDALFKVLKAGGPLELSVTTTEYARKYHARTIAVLLGFE